MRFVFLPALLASTTLAVAADDVAFSGKWQLQQSIAGNESTQTCTFTQKGTDLSGSCGGQQGPVQINGKIDGKKVNWMFKGEYNGSPLTVRYAGAMDDQKKISGTVTVEEYSVSGDFTATPAT